MHTEPTVVTDLAPARSEAGDRMRQRLVDEIPHMTDAMLVTLAIGQLDIARVHTTLFGEFAEREMARRMIRDAGPAYFRRRVEAWTEVIAAEPGRAWCMPLALRPYVLRGAELPVST